MDAGLDRHLTDTPESPVTVLAFDSDGGASLTTDGRTTFHAVGTSDAEDYQPEVSPDGRWLAYTSERW